ncbi:MAG TPA: hypothetical protein ENJ19_06285 [Gammaproteobacteria bacterium]|nr:hypothetical protein [Gammaproteobacteria bacterium]
MAGVFKDSRKLYQLLPAVYRERDAQEGYPLRALLGLVEEQADILYEDIQRLWDNFFIETCDGWVVPYIGDLVSNNPLHDAERFTDAQTAEQLFEDLTGPSLAVGLALRSRADVAKTIYYRRRKGTLPMLEELARDVTGWASHGVEFFRLLGWTQNLNHLRLGAGGTMALRQVEPADRLNGPFDRWAHTVDVRAPVQTEGWYNIPNIGFFLWRLRSNPLEAVTPRRGGLDWQYHFSPLGNPAPLFNAWRREGDEAGLATEYHVPGPLRPAYFFDDLQAHRRQYPRSEYTPLYAPLDQGGSLYIERNGVPVTPAADYEATPDLYAPQIICRQLDPWPAVQPGGRVIAVDVATGRLAIGDGWGDATERLDVHYHYGFPADLGGGPYERGPWLVDETLPELQLFVQQDNPPADYHATLSSALTAWAAAGRPNATITVLDNRSYPEALDIELANDRWLVIQAANGVRPHIQPGGGAITLSGGHPESALTLSGLLVEGAVAVNGDTGRLRLLHTTLVPGRSLTEAGLPAGTAPSVIVADVDGGGATINTDFILEAAFSITGPLRLPESAQGLWLLDSIVDGLGGTAISATGTSDQSGPSAVIERCTVVGPSYFHSLKLATEVIFTGTVTCEQRHEGCVRFSYVTANSRTPRRYRCQPDWEILTVLTAARDEKGSDLTPVEDAAIRSAIEAWLVPGFTSIHYGHPGYAQLRRASPRQIRTGAEDGSEMGAYCHLKQPQRETNLRIRLEEYLPFGLVPGIIYVT